MVAVAVALGTLYLLRFTDWTGRRQIQISVIERPFAPNARPGDVLPLIFALDRDCKVTELRVSALESGSGLATSDVWHLTSKSGSQPLRGFAYGDEISGMKAGRPPGALIGGAAYRLEVMARSARGETNFVPHYAVPPPGQ